MLVVRLMFLLLFLVMGAQGFAQRVTQIAGEDYIVLYHWSHQEYQDVAVRHGYWDEVLMSEAYKSQAVTMGHGLYTDMDLDSWSEYAGNRTNQVTNSTHNPHNGGLIEILVKKSRVEELASAERGVYVLHTPSKDIILQEFSGAGMRPATRHGARRCGALKHDVTEHRT